MVIGALARRGEAAEAEALLGEMCEVGLRPDSVTFSSLMVPSNDDAPAAAAWLDAMQAAGVAPDLVCYNKVIACYSRARLPEIGQEWLGKMAAAGIAPNVVSFSSVMSGYAKQAQPDDCVALLRRMHAEGVRADTVTLNALLEAHARAAQPQQALVWLRRMERADAPADGAPPDVVHDRDCALARASRVDDAADGRQGARAPTSTATTRSLPGARGKARATRLKDGTPASPRTSGPRPSARGVPPRGNASAGPARRLQEPPPLFCVTSLGRAGAGGLAALPSGGVDPDAVRPARRRGGAQRFFCKMVFLR